MIQSFSDTETEKLFKTEKSGRFSAILRIALRKLIQLNQAASLDDMKVPQGNRLEALKGDRKGQYSIRITRQWRIVFEWNDHGPSEVGIMDYH